MNRKNPLNESEVEAARGEVTIAARALCSRELPFLEGVQRLAALRFKVSRDDHDPDFMLFVAIESQADHIPPSKARALCAEQWLAQCDKDARELEALYGQQVVEACKCLIERFATKA